MTMSDGDYPVEQLWRVSVELVRALEASIHFVENVDRLTGEDPASPWPDWYPNGYVGLLTSLQRWYDLLTPPSDPM